MLGLASKPSALWGTYRQFAEAGHQVAKGEKSHQIFFFKPYAVRDRETDEEKQIMLAKSYNVFNLSQLTDPPEITIEKRPEIETDAQAEELIKASGADIRIGGDKAFYTPAGDYVVMPHKDQFDSREAYYSTLFHETGGHWTGHPKRLNRDMSGRFGSEAYAIEEILAEAATAFICTAIEIIPAPRKESARYINNWLTVLRNDKRAAITIFSQAQKAADYFLHGLQNG